MVSSTLGSPTNTCWNRRSSAASFSMCSRYSSSVVAPTIRSSPRASIGLSMLDASIAPSPVAPAPTTVCSSSMNVTTCPPESLISSRTALSRSSNSPRYFAPAIIAPMSSAISRLLRSDSGTSPATMRCARPSTTAVFPTPGSPISTGLFFVRRDSTWTTRRISESRPMTGSILPSRARSVRSTPYFSSAWNVPSGSGEVIFRSPPRTTGNASTRASDVAPTLIRISAASLPGSGQRGEQVLGGQVLVAGGPHDLLGAGDDVGDRTGQLRLRDGAAGHPRQSGEHGVGPRLDGLRVGPDRAQQAGGRGSRGHQQCDQQVRRLHRGVAGGGRAGDRRGDHLAALRGQNVQVHVSDRALRACVW